MPTTTLRANIARLRHSAGLTQQACADAIGCRLGTWQRWELYTDPPIGRLESIADLFGTTPSRLLSPNPHR